MQISCNTFEAFVVTLSRNCHCFGELNCRHSQIQSIMGQVHNPCKQLLDVSWRVQHLPPDGHSDFLPSPQWHTLAWRYFDSSPFHVSSIRPYSKDRSHSIRELHRDRRHSPPCHHLLTSALFPIHILSTSVSSATSNRRVNLCTTNHQHARRENITSLMLKHPWMGNRLCEHPVKECLPEVFVLFWRRFAPARCALFTSL